MEFFRGDSAYCLRHAAEKYGGHKFPGKRFKGGESLVWAASLQTANTWPWRLLPHLRCTTQISTQVVRSPLLPGQVGSDDDGYAVRLKLKHFLRYASTTRDDNPLYIFDGSFAERCARRSPGRLGLGVGGEVGGGCAGAPARNKRCKVCCVGV